MILPVYNNALILVKRLNSYSVYPYQLVANKNNNTENGKTQAGGDYYYSYGEGLFIVLNTNNYNVAEHQKTIEEAVKAYPDAKWRIVTVKLMYVIYIFVLSLTLKIVSLHFIKKNRE